MQNFTQPRHSSCSTVPVIMESGEVAMEVRTRDCIQGSKGALEIVTAIGSLQQ